jgi:hypothetical protein
LETAAGPSSSSNLLSVNVSGPNEISRIECEQVKIPFVSSELESNYPRLDEKGRNWMRRFFWRSLALSFVLSNLSWILAFFYFLRTGDNPIEPKLDLEPYLDSLESLMTISALVILIFQLIVNLILGFLLARKDQEPCKSVPMRLGLHVLQIILLIAGFYIWAIITD